MVCTNDEMIMVYSLPSMRELAKIQLPTAVNYGELEGKGLWKDGRKERTCWMIEELKLILYRIGIRENSKLFPICDRSRS